MPHTPSSFFSISRFALIYNGPRLRRSPHYPLTRQRPWQSFTSQYRLKAMKCCVDCLFQLVSQLSSCRYFGEHKITGAKSSFAAPCLSFTKYLSDLSKTRTELSAIVKRCGMGFISAQLVPRMSSYGKFGERKILGCKMQQLVRFVCHPSFIHKTFKITE